MVMKPFASYPPGRVVHLADNSSDISYIVVCFHDGDGDVNRGAKIKLKQISVKTPEALEW
jgi:hypothetical protein